MSSYATYTLTIRNINDKIEEFCDELKDRKLVANPFAPFDESYYIDKKQDIWFFSNDIMRWSDYDIVMTELSKEYPDAIFKLHCEADGAEMWDEYYQNGNYEYCGYVATKPKTIKWED